jgi:hypothetical protein
MRLAGGILRSNAANLAGCDVRRILNVVDKRPLPLFLHSGTILLN